MGHGSVALKPSEKAGGRAGRGRYPTVPLMALTATATPRVQHDVVQQLALRDCCVFRSSFNRSNLRCAPQPLRYVSAHPA